MIEFESPLFFPETKERDISTVFDHQGIKENVPDIHLRASFTQLKASGINRTATGPFIEIFTDIVTIDLHMPVRSLIAPITALPAAAAELLPVAAVREVKADDGR